MMTKKPDKHLLYEEEKRRLRALKLPPAQYEAAIKELVRRLKI